MNETTPDVAQAPTAEPKTIEQLRAEWEALVLEEERRADAYGKTQREMMHEKLALGSLSEKRRVAEEAFLSALRDEARARAPEAPRG